MRAMVLTEYGRPLELHDVPERPLAPREVLLRVKASALCASDVHAQRGGYKNPSGRFGGIVPPIILGHQIAGEVVEAGPGAEAPDPGTLCVVYCYLFCGRCKRCLEGRQNVCERVAQRIGFEVPGGFANLVCVPDHNLFPAPAGMSPDEVSVLPDAVTTSYHAIVRRADVRPEESVVVFGVGALGLYAVRIAALRGARVVAVDRVDDKRLEWARSFGAEEAFSWESGISPDQGFLTKLRELLDDRVDVVIDLVGVSETLVAAAGVLRENGRLLLIGVTQHDRLPLAPFAARKIQIITSLASTPGDLMDVIDLAARGLIRPLVADSFRVEEINDGLERLARGNAVGRLVAIP